VSRTPPKEWRLSQTKETKEPKDAKGDKKPRVFNLAADLKLDTKIVLEFCKELGFTSIKNQLNALDPEQVDALKDRAKKGAPKPSSSAATSLPAAKPATPPKLDVKIPTLSKPKPVAPSPAPIRSAPVAVEPSRPAPVAVEPPRPAPVEPVRPAPLPPPRPNRVPNIAPPPAPVAEALPKPAAIEAPPVVVDVPTPVVEAVQAVAPVEESRPELVEAEAPSTSAPTVILPAPSARMPNLLQRPLTPMGSNRPQMLGASGKPSTPPAPRPPAPNPPPPRPLGQGPPRSAPNPAPPPNQYTPRPGGMPPRSGPGGGPPGGAQRAGGLPPRSSTAGGPARPGGTPVRPGGPTLPAKPGTLAAAAAQGASKQIKLTPEQIQRLRQLEQARGKVVFDNVHKATAPADAPPPVRPGLPGPGGLARPKPIGPQDAEPEGGGGGGDDDRKGAVGPGGKRPGEVAGRDARHKARQDKGRQGAPIINRSSINIQGGQVETVDERFGSRRGPRAALLRKQQRRQQVIKKIEGKVDILLPITVRTLSETIGMKAGELILKLKNLTNSLYTINSNLDFETAEVIAIDKGIELVAKKQADAEDDLLDSIRKRGETADDSNQILRPPVVTIMGHVDHGKTSLLDKIRQTYGHASDVVSTEHGGITQVLRAWRVEKDSKSTTFLDTPGHEAFTKMRARGANVTDIAVIVVSASDGVMPQTEEAIAHAKAAGVDIIVAINKVDLPDANIDRTRRMLYQLNLLPDNMGGEVPFVECSAKTGKGIDELLDNIATLAELAELKADPTHAATGTCLEAYKEGERGVIATLLVQDGTIHKGDVLLCGSTFGRVRAMYDDLGRAIEEAGPSTPVKVIGLDEVPDADDPFYVVDDLATAQEIAENRKDRRQEAALSKFSPVSLDKLKEANSKAKITELKVVLKAEARGSVEAIKKELEKLLHEEVRVRLLHAGIGAINESDVTLALTSPDDTLVIGFNVTADDAALRIADARGLSIREYQIIYNLVDDVKAALEGRLKPVEEVVHLGRAVVREVFKISKVGSIAGCHVTSGVIERNNRIRVIRDGTVLYPPAEKNAVLDSLKRFKDDVKEVREGFECGLKIAGFNDVKSGDVIEAFRIDIRHRTL